MVGIGQFRSKMTLAKNPNPISLSGATFPARGAAVTAAIMATPAERQRWGACLSSTPHHSPPLCISWGGSLSFTPAPPSPGASAATWGDSGGDSVFRTPLAAGYCFNGWRDDMARGSISVEVGATKSCHLRPPWWWVDDDNGLQVQQPSFLSSVLHFPPVAWLVDPSVWRSGMGRSGWCDGDAAPSRSPSHTEAGSNDSCFLFFLARGSGCVHMLK